MLAGRIQDLEKELLSYFSSKKQAEIASYSALSPSQVDTSLNESLEQQLPVPLAPEPSSRA